MAIKAKEQAVIDLVINGQQANSSLRELTGAYNALFAQVSRLRDADDPAYKAEQVALLAQVKAARDAERASVLATTHAIEDQKDANKGFFADFMDGFKSITERAGEVTAGTLLYKGISSIIDGAKGLWDQVWSGSEAAFNESAKSQAQLDAALRSTQGIAGVTKQAMNDLAKVEMDKTAIDDDVINKSEEMLLTFSNVRGKIYDQAVPAIVDMTSALNQGDVSMSNIQQTSILVGKALNDPINGMTALRKVGVTLNEQQRENIKTLVETNHLQDAQVIILQELQKEFGGNAKAVADSEAGPMLKFNTRIGNIQESIGQWIVKGKSLAVDVLNPLLGWVEDFVSTPLSESLHEDQASFLGLRVELESVNTTAERRHTLIDQLKAQYPGYLSQVDSDKVKNSELLPILDKINQAFVLRIAYQTRAEKLDKAIKDEADAINDTYDQKQKLIMRIGEIQQMVAEDGIKFTIKGNTEEEKAIFIRKNLLNAISEQAKGNKDLNNVLASNKYDNLISGLNVYGNALVSSTRKQKDNHEQVKQLTDDLTKFKQSSGYNDVIPGADLLQALSVKVNTLKAVLDITQKGSAEYVKMVATLKEANNELKNGANDPEILKGVQATLDKIDELTKPTSGPSAATLAKEQRARELAAKKLEAYNKELQDTRDSMNLLAEAARKGTVDDLDAQLKVIEDKYRSVVDNINKLLKDPHTSAAVRKELTDRLKTLPSEAQLAKDNTTSAFNKKTDDQAQKDNDDEFKAASGRVDNIYASGQGELDKQQNADLSSISGSDPEIVEAQRLNVKELYAQKSFELEQKHLADLKSINQAYGKDSGALDKKIADNTIKENERASREKLTKDQAYTNAKKEISQLELSTLQSGAQLLESVLDKRSALYKAALIVDKTVAIANINIATEVAITKFKASVAALGPFGAGLGIAYEIAARASEAISIATVIKSVVDGFGGDKSTGGSGATAAKGGVFNGASHDQGGLNVVDPKTGQTVVNVEGGEPFMVLSRETRRNNGALINQLLFNSMFRNGAAVDVAGVDKGIQVAKNGGVFSAAAIQALTVRQSDSLNNNPSPALNNQVDLSELVQEMRATREAIKDQKVIFNDRVYDQYKQRKLLIQNTANG